MADATDAAPVVPPVANPDSADDTALAARATALVAALRSGDSAAQNTAAEEIKALTADNEEQRREPANPRSVAALLAAGATAALLELMRSPGDTVPVADDHSSVSAANALGELMFVSDAVTLEVTGALSVDALLQMLHDSKDAQQRMLAFILWLYTKCEPWLASLSPDSDLVSRIVSLPFLKTADAYRDYATRRIVDSLAVLVQQRPTFRPSLLVPAHLYVLVELLVLRDRADDDPELDVQAAACYLLNVLQNFADHDFVTFDKARVYVACVELLGELARHGITGYVYVEAARVLATAYTRSPALQPRITHLLLTCPGALAGVAFAVGDACNCAYAAAAALLTFLDALRVDIPGSAQFFLVDAQFAAFALVFSTDIDHAGYQELLDAFISEWKTPDNLRALEQPLHHQKLTAAVSLASLTDAGVAFERLLAADDRLEVLIAALIDLATDRKKMSALGNSPAGQAVAVRQSLLVEQGAIIDDAGADEAAGADEPSAKRRRTFCATLRASDVNVQRRDSTVLIIAGRPFYVIGALVEAKSVVLAEALSNAATLDPVTIALPNEVPEELQYDLFHAAVELAYTGKIASTIDAASLLPLWCIGDHLQMDELCAWCTDRLPPALSRDAALLERAWLAALARPSDVLCDVCAVSWLVMEEPLSRKDKSAMLLLKRVHDGCANKEMPAAQLVRVLRRALLAKIAQEEAAAPIDDL